MVWRELVWHVLSDSVVVEGSIDVVDEEGRERIQAFLFPFDGESDVLPVVELNIKLTVNHCVAIGVAELELVLGDGHGHMDVGLCVIWVVVAGASEQSSVSVWFDPHAYG
jgi:hypothetical protein